MKYNKIYNQVLDETLYHGKHKSGLNVYVLPKKGYNKSYATFATRYGSVDSKFIVPGEQTSTEVPDGIAHFLEHKLFEDEDGNSFDKFSRLGSSANAYTSFNTTAYLFSATQKFYENLQVLLEFVQNPYFTDESIHKEQGIIAQEIGMYNDDPDWKVFFNLLAALYHNHPVKKDIAGTVESISKINKDILYKCYNTFYRPSNMILFAVGDLKKEDIASYVDKYIKNDEIIKTDIERVYPIEPNEVYKQKIEEKLTLSIPLFQVGFKDNDVGYGGINLLKKDIITRIILKMIMGKSTSLYYRLFKEGLINDTFSTDYMSEKDYGITMYGGESINPEKVSDEISCEIENLLKTGLDKQAFERAKKSIYGNFIKQFNSIERLANSFVSNLFKDINLLDYISVYESISIEDVDRRFKQHFNLNNMAISIIK